MVAAELAMVAKNEIAVSGRDGGQLLKLLELLDGHDDVQHVDSNADLDEALLAQKR